MKLSDLMRLLEQKYGVVVCLEPKHPAFTSLSELHLHPDQYLHHGSYCVFAKRAGGIPICSTNKTRSVELASKGRAFTGACPLGLRESVQPVMFEDKLVAVLYAGHYSSGAKPQNVNGQEYAGALGPELSVEKEREMKKELRFASDLVKWEIDFWIKKGGQTRKRNDDQYYWEQLEFYIAHNYSENIMLSSLAETLDVNPNYLSGIIKRQSGRNFRYLLNERRIEEAKTYLKFHPKLNITEIGTLCGFVDSNYFSTVFRRHTGVSPRAFRGGAPAQQ